MMKTYLKRAFQLSDSGVKGLAKSIWSFFLYYVSFVPPMICVFLFADRLLNGNTGKPVVYLLFMLAATLVMYLVINYLADRVMVMRCGKIIEDRTFHGSTDCFTHPYTKLLLHSIAPYLG